MGFAWATPVDFTSSAVFFLKPGGGSSDKQMADPGQSLWLVNLYSLPAQSPEAVWKRAGI